MNKLAIIIPAFKATFFEEALKSLAQQTLNNFNVYIGDDCSHEDLKTIVKRFSELDIVYHRFQDNMGARNMVNQWRRCVELSQNEDWIWLFSDDDYVDKNCVENFYRRIERDQNQIDVYRFNTVVVNKDKELIWRSPLSPLWESSEKMAYELLLGNRGNSISDHIFKRSIYVENGGFIFTEYAQGADWATSIKFSKRNGLGTIAESNFYWRYSGLNVSASNQADKQKMVKGHLQFIKWTKKHFKYLQKGGYDISHNQMLEAIKTNLNTVLQNHYKSLSGYNLLLVVIFYFSNFFDKSTWRNTITLINKTENPIRTTGRKFKKLFSNLDRS